MDLRLGFPCGISAVMRMRQGDLPGEEDLSGLTT